MDKELAGWSHSNSCSWWLDIWVETSCKWPSSGWVVLSSELFNICVGEMDSVIECTLDAFVEGIKLRGVAQWMEGMPSRGTLMGLRNELLQTSWRSTRMSVTLLKITKMNGWKSLYGTAPKAIQNCKSFLYSEGSNAYVFCSQLFC